MSTSTDAVESALCLACAQGDRRAVQLFEQRYFPSARRAVARLVHDPDVVEEVLQQLRHRLFVPNDDGQAAIVRATGRGNLVEFVRVCAMRQALNLVRGERRRGVRNDNVGRDVLGDAFEDPELQLGRRISSEVLKTAFERAIEALMPKQRNLLRHHLVDHLNLDQLARRFGVHRRTVARWLASARAEVVRSTRAEITRMLGEAGDEAALRALLHSRLELSLTRVLAGQGAIQTPVST